jgi:hypothetical protein
MSMTTDRTNEVTTSAPPSPPAASTESVQPLDTVIVRRRTIDRILIGFGIVATVAFAIAGGLLLWGNQFASDYVGDELSSQNITFPTADALTEEGRTDLLEYAGESLTTGAQAEAYASYIDGHLEGIADGATFADLGGPERAAKAAVADAVAADAPQSEVDELQATAAGITAQRDSLFRGETLRGLLLSAYAWSTVGMIAGLAAIGAFLAAAVMAVLVIIGIVHYRRTPKDHDPALA